MEQESKVEDEIVVATAEVQEQSKVEDGDTAEEQLKQFVLITGLLIFVLEVGRELVGLVRLAIVVITVLIIGVVVSKLI